MDLSLIDCFVKVADSRSISAASRRYRLPKSTLSHKIRQLEDEFGIELFVREGHQLHVTDAGAEFLRYAGMQWTVAVINYGIFVLVIVLRPQIQELFALVISSGVAMVFSYLGMRFAAFRHGGVRPGGSDIEDVGSGE